MKRSRRGSLAGRGFHAITASARAEASCDRHSRRAVRISSQRFVTRTLGALIGLGLALVVVVGTAPALSAQRGRGGPPPAPRAGTVERITVRDRQVTVYLPPSYATDAMRRFPVVYLLADGLVEALKLPEAADKLAAAQGFSEPIVVGPAMAGAAD